MEPSLSRPLAIEAYKAYARHFAEINEQHPQRCGLTFEEFCSALDDPRVMTTEIRADGHIHYVPQLGPLTQYNWLNESRYTEEFPQESARHALLHYTELPGVSPSAQVLDGLHQLAEDRGVLLFDYPALDEGYLQRLREVFELARIGAGPVLELARQTYFIGSTHIRGGPVGPKPLDIREVATRAFDADADEVSGSGSLLRMRVDAASALRFREFYDRAYKKLNELEFCKQGLDPDEFMQMLVDSDGVLKVLHAVEGSVVAMLLLSPELEDLGWINPQYFLKRFRSYDRGQLLWFPALAADPGHPEIGNTEAMLDLVGALHQAASNEPLVLFDCGILNTGFLDAFLEEIANQSSRFSMSIEPTCQHVYAALRLHCSE